MASGVVCFTGHRNKYFPFFDNEQDEQCVNIKNAIASQIEYLINSHGVDRFITGMALGADTWCAEAVLNLQSHYPHIKLYAALPCSDQSARWNRQKKQRWTDILNRCEKVHVLRENYTPDCMMARNKFMVNNADFVLAVYSDRRRSGTGATVAYARNQNKKLLIIDPEILSVTKENF